MLLFHSFFVAFIRTDVFIKLFFIIKFLLFIFSQFILKPFFDFTFIYFIFDDTEQTVFRFAHLIFIQTSNAFDNFLVNVYKAYLYHHPFVTYVCFIIFETIHIFPLNLLSFHLTFPFPC